MQIILPNAEQRFAPLVPLATLRFEIKNSQSHPFPMPQNFKTQDCHWNEVKPFQSISVDKGNIGTEKDLGTFLH